MKNKNHIKSNSGIYSIAFAGDNNNIAETSRSMKKKKKRIDELIRDSKTVDDLKALIKWDFETKHSLKDSKMLLDIHQKQHRLLNLALFLITILSKSSPFFSLSHYLVKLDLNSIISII